jgi:hypothetical protein
MSRSSVVGLSLTCLSSLFPLDLYSDGDFDNTYGYDILSIRGFECNEVLLTTSNKSDDKLN